MWYILYLKVIQFLVVEDTIVVPITDLRRRHNHISLTTQ